MIVNPFGGQIYHFAQISSTMDIAKKNLSSGNLFTADYQTQGRGRVYQRQWQSEKSKNLLFTLVLPLSDSEKSPISLLAALALHRALFAYSIHAQIKWPNDVLVNDAKIAGILAEVYQDYVLLGIGINVNQTDFSNVEKEITSMKLLLGKDSHSDELLSQFLQELYTLVHHQQDWNREINEHLWARDRVVDYYIDIRHQKKISGKIICVQSDGALQIMTEQGLEVLYSAEN